MALGTATGVLARFGSRRRVAKLVMITLLSSLLELIIVGMMPRGAAAGGATGRILHSFCLQADCVDGSLPFAGLIMDASGNLYGTTAAGGNTNSRCGGASNGGDRVFPGCGVVFELARIGTDYVYKVLYRFCSKSNCSDGDGPVADLIIDAAGNLYGTTSAGGNTGNTNSRGVVFELTPNQAQTAWTYSVLYRFCSKSNCVDGASPFSDLIMDRDGNLFGTTQDGGNQLPYGSGVIFEMTPNQSRTAWTETVLYCTAFAQSAIA